MLHAYFTALAILASLITNHGNWCQNQLRSCHILIIARQDHSLLSHHLYLPNRGWPSQKHKEAKINSEQNLDKGSWVICREIRWNRREQTAKYLRGLSWSYQIRIPKQINIQTHNGNPSPTSLSKNSFFRFFFFLVTPHMDLRLFIGEEGKIWNSN